jgi:5,10-methylenetetrahydromethanopterin reductase
MASDLPLTSLGAQAAATAGRPLTWGVHFVPSGGTAPLLGAAATLERAGVAEISLSDEAFSVEPLAALAAIAARHPSLRVGVRVTNPYVRHPLTLAREARVLADVAERGVVLGLGLGGAMSLNSTGMMARRRIAGLLAALGAVRGLLAGERVALRTEDFVVEGRLDDAPPPPARVRFELTGRGPKMMAAAAVHGDAVLVVGSSFEEGARTIARVRDAARAGGRAAPPPITWSTYAVPDESLLDDLKPYFAYGLAEATTADRGLDPASIAELREVLHREGRHAAGRLVPREYVAERVAIGSPAACRESLARFAAEQGVETVLIRVPESARRERWLEAACAVAGAAVPTAP